jgi:hypothetical protein
MAHAVAIRSQPFAGSAPQITESFEPKEESFRREAGYTHGEAKVNPVML